MGHKILNHGTTDFELEGTSEAIKGNFVLQVR